MSQKAPAFLFYVKDWLTDDVVKQMSWRDQGLYVHLLCVAWLQDPPGTLPADPELRCKIAAISLRDCRDFVAKWPQIWIQIGAKLVNKKMQKVYEEMRERSQRLSDRGNKGAEARWPSTMQQAMPKQCIASASAFASAKKEGDVGFASSGSSAQGSEAAPEPQPQRPSSSDQKPRSGNAPNQDIHAGTGPTARMSEERKQHLQDLRDEWNRKRQNGEIPRELDFDDFKKRAGEATK